MDLQPPPLFARGPAPLVRLTFFILFASFLMVLDGPGPGLPLPCVMYEHTPQHLEWGGGGLGSCIRHSMQLTPLGPSRTRLRHREYATGLLALATWPLREAAAGHDRRWSEAIVARFAGG